MVRGVFGFLENKDLELKLAALVLLWLPIVFQEGEGYFGRLIGSSLFTAW